MKIEPGTLCVVKSACSDANLRGRLVVASWWCLRGEAFGPVYMPDQLRRVMPPMRAPEAAWACCAANEGGTLSASVENDSGFVCLIEFRYLPIPAQWLQPIAGPSIDTTETGDRSLHAARSMDDETWSTGAVWL